MHTITFFKICAGESFEKSFTILLLSDLPNLTSRARCMRLCVKVSCLHYLKYNLQLTRVQMDLVRFIAIRLQAGLANYQSGSAPDGHFVLLGLLCIAHSIGSIQGTELMTACKLQSIYL